MPGDSGVGAASVVEALLTASLGAFDFDGFMTISNMLHETRSSVRPCGLRTQTEFSTRRGVRAGKPIREEHESRARNQAEATALSLPTAENSQVPERGA